jgi:glycosyltransferase involved in cell wall biosynthesis
MVKKPTVDISIPVYYKDASHLPLHIQQQLDFFSKALFRYDWKIIITNNGPKKDALSVAQQLSKKYPRVQFADIDNPGRGWSLSSTWYSSKADIVMYMDSDLATNLKSVASMLDLLASDRCDIAIGSRYVEGAKTRRTFHRNLLSKVYNLMLYYLLGLKVLDAQCGFKAVNKRVVQNILPFIKDCIWFWESEMLYYAYKKGYKIKEVPVHWTENPKSGVNLIKIIPTFMKNVLRLRFSRLPL